MEPPRSRLGQPAAAITAWCQRGADGLTPDEAQLAKRVNVFLLCGFVAAGVQLTSMLLAGYWWSSLQLVAYVGLLWLARRIVLRGDSLRSAIGVGCAATLMLFFASSFLDGQALSPTLWFFGIVPLAATYLLGTRSGMLWAAVALVGLVVVSESPMVLTVPQEVHQQGAGLLAQQVILLAILMGCAVGARTLSDRQIERLREREAEVAEASRLKSEFLANMSHEIRTPMNGVLGMLEILAGTELDADQRDLAQTAWSSARVLLGLLDDILDFSKIEAGRLDIESVPFDVARVVLDVAALFENAASSKGLALRAEIDPTLEGTVTGDPTRIRQVLCNLVGNAVKFTEEGGVVVSARPAGGDTVSLSVRDTGIGIPADVHDVLFDSFRQADGSTTRRYGGTGLGLTISRQLVVLMGGEITFTSEHGAGSEFTVTLKLPADDTTGCATAVTAPLAEAAATRIGPRHGHRVLVAEDNLVNQRITVTQLESLGYDVEVASDGLEAVAIAAARAFDIVLMDCHMPRMDGFKATRALRSLPGGTTLPVVAVTASVLTDDLERCRDAGMDDVLTKPFTRAELGAVVERWTATAVRPA